MVVVCRTKQMCVAGVLFCGLLTGCGGSPKLPTIPVQGVVTLEGQPLKEARVRFVPDAADKGRTAIGDTDASGNFKLSTVRQNDGIIPGSYKVDVSSLATVTTESKEKGKSSVATEIPAKYADVKTSGLTFTIGQGDANKSLEIKLTKK